MGEHTKGPWEACERGDYSDYRGDSRVILGDDMRIAVVHDSGIDRQEANARLIAAAPELLEALELLLDSVIEDVEITGNSPDDIFEIVKSRAAIANAKGQGA